VSRAFEYTCALLALSTQGDGLRSPHALPKVPLAYIRALAVPPPVFAVRSGASGAADLPLPEPERRKLTERAAAQLDDALRGSLAKLKGLRIVSEMPDSAKLVSAAQKSALEAHPERDRVSPSIGPGIQLLARRLAEETGTDGVLLIAVDRFGVRTAFFREVWMRVVAHVVIERSGEVRGPIYAVGQARTAPRLVRAGFMRSDAELVTDAAADACANLIHGLERGDTAPFAADVRVAVIPAAVPDGAIAADQGAGTVERILVPALARQADVLFQPDIGPVAEHIGGDQVVAAMVGLGLTSGQLWTDSGADAAAAASVARALGAHYVFVSRVRAASVGRYESEDGSESVGDIAEVVADFGLVRADDARVLWRSDGSGSARSHIYTPEGPRRIRTRPQCVMDAAVAAFASGRFALEEWMRGRRK